MGKKNPTETILNYNAANGYAGGDMVFKDNKLYKSNNATAPGWVDVDWDEQRPYVGFVSDYDIKETYLRDDLVYVPAESKVYVCIAAANDPVTGAWNATKLAALQDGTVITDIKAYPFTGDGKVSGEPKLFQVKQTFVDETKVP